MNIRRGWLLGAVVAVLVAGATGASAAEMSGDGASVVTPESPGRFVETHDGAGALEFSDRLGSPQGGNDGALVLSTPSDDDTVQFVTDELSGPLGEFADAGYWTRRDPAAGDDPRALPSFRIVVDLDGGAAAPQDLRVLTFVPSRGGEEWTEQDAGSGTWCVTLPDGGPGAEDAIDAGCPASERRTIAQIVGEHPGVTALAAGVSQGHGDGGLVAAVDLVHAGSRTYDLEPTAP